MKVFLIKSESTLGAFLYFHFSIKDMQIFFVQNIDIQRPSLDCNLFWKSRSDSKVASLEIPYIESHENHQSACFQDNDNDWARSSI